MTYSPDETSTDDLGARGPSSALWASALAGLLGLAGACGDDGNKIEPDPDAPVVADAAVDSPEIDAPPDAPPSKIISETQGDHTFAELTAMCDQRGGYTQITAACAGANMCAGFSYGDWSPGVLTEHSCNAVNGCNGISCVVLPADQGRTALDILGDAPSDAEGVPQRSCMNCHADWSGAAPDPTHFKVWVPPGSTRTLANWLDRPAGEQARYIAFGSTGVYAGGQAYSHMAQYYKLYSRAEIERVVAYIRTTATVEIATVKVNDTPTARLHPTRPHRAGAIRPGGTGGLLR